MKGLAATSLHVALCISTVYAWVELDPKLIPTIDSALPILSLGAPASLPIDIIETLLRRYSPDIRLVVNASAGPGLYAYDGENLFGVVNGTDGETHIFPKFPSLKPTRHFPIAAKSVIKRIPSLGLSKHGEGAFPLDDTDLELVQGSNLITTDYSPLAPSTSNRRHNTNLAPPSGTGNATLPHAYLSYALIKRTIRPPGYPSSFPVCGPGSLAKFGVDSTHQLASISYSWRPATFTSQRIKPNTTSLVVENIKRYFEPDGLESGGITVTKVDVCYYDPGLGLFMQPVYRFRGTYTRLKASSRGLRDLLGYLPIGATSPEAIRHLRDILDPERPVEPNLHDLRRRSSPPSLFDKRQAPRLPIVTLGRYIIRSDNLGFIYNANAFRRTLTSSPLAKFINEQYFWAYPFIYGRNPDIVNLYINHVHVALTEGHGFERSFSTLSADRELVNIRTGLIPGGYGAGTGGQLAFWFLDAGENIPSSIDFPEYGLGSPGAGLSSMSPWWDVFNGLSAVLGWRTATLLSDNVVAKAGELMAMGVPVVNAWITAANSDAVYARNDPPTYFSARNGRTQPYGKAAVVYKCGRVEAKIWDVTPADKGCGPITMIYEDDG